MQRHRPTRRLWCVSIAAITGLTAALAGCGSSDEDDAAPGDAEETEASSPDREPSTATAPVTSSPPTTSAAQTFSIATTPGWQGLLEPILAGLNRIGDGAPTFDLDAAWMDANGAEDVEQRILSAVAAGELDAGYVGVRALSALDVPGFDALVAPGLIDSYELQEAVLRSDVPDRLLPGLDRLGVTGLAVVAGPMRYPIGVERPFVGPADFAGATFHTFAAEVNVAAAEALGATHSQLWGDERNDAIDAGTIDVTENSLDWMRDNGRGAYVTLGALWPATAVFVVNADLLAALPASQVEAMQSAIADAAPSAARLVEAADSVIADLCSHGKQIVTPSADDSAALVAALRPVYDTLAADAAAGPILADIEALKPSVSPTSLSAPGECVAAPAVTAVGTDDPGVLNGSYTLEWTFEELMTQFDVDERTALGNDGPFVLILQDGTFDMVWQDVPDDSCGGTYGVSGDRVQFVAADDLATWTCGGESLGMLVLDAAWSLEGDQLVLSDFSVSPEPDITWWNAGFFSKPLTRVAG